MVEVVCVVVVVNDVVSRAFVVNGPIPCVVINDVVEFEVSLLGNGEVMFMLIAVELAVVTSINFG